MYKVLTNRVSLTEENKQKQNKREKKAPNNCHFNFVNIYVNIIYKTLILYII